LPKLPATYPKLSFGYVADTNHMRVVGVFLCHHINIIYAGNKDWWLIICT